MKLSLPLIGLIVRYRAYLIQKKARETMSSTEVKLVFTATFKVSGDNAIENAIERARAEYGNEVADYGVFTVEGEGEYENN
jgi:hypothetical protein